ncbi:MAG: acyltransferase family protein [Steroidobacteraceae bacterium]
MEFRGDINGLRAVAVLAVLLYHFGVPGFAGGFVGVDIFYVISGYLMTGILLGRLPLGRNVLISFYLARARRIVPALLGLCAAVMLLGWFWISPVHYRELAMHAAASLAFVSNIVYWQQVNYFNPDAEGYWLLHTWSLSVEWQFYLLYPLALLLLARLYGTGDGARFRLAILVALLLSLGLAIVATMTAPQAAFYLLPSRAWELLAGGLVWLHQRQFAAATSHRQALVFIGVLLLLSSIVLLDDASSWATLMVAIPVAGSVLVLLGNRPTFLLANPVCQAIGRWSYSIYLWHWPIAVFLRESGAGLNWQRTLAGISMSMLLGYGSFLFIETPSRKGLGSLKTKAQLLWQAAGAGALALCAGAVVMANGYPQRAPLDNAATYQRMESDLLRWDFPASCSSALSPDGNPRICSLGSGGTSGRVLVLGDSHAQQWYPWFESAAASSDLHIDFVTYEGCSVGYEPRPGMNCGTFWSGANDLARKLQPDLVILMSNWQVPPPQAQSTESSDRPDSPRGRVRQRLPSILTNLHRTGTPVVVIGTFPRIGDRVPDDIISRLFRGSGVDVYQQVDCAAFRLRARSINEDLRNISETAGTMFLNPLDTLCAAGPLSVISTDHHLLYRDGNHVSSAGALRWGELLFGKLLAESRTYSK